MTLRARAAWVAVCGLAAFVAACLPAAFDETEKRCGGPAQTCSADYACLAGRCFPGPAPTNLLVNPDFEEMQARAGWSLGGHLASSAERSQVQHGAQALRLTLTEGTQDSSSVSPQLPPVPDGAGQLFCFSGYAAVPGSSSDVAVRFLESVDGGLPASSTAASGLAGTDYTPFSGGHRGKSGASLSVELVFSGRRAQGDALLVDDFTLWASVDGGCP